MKKRNSQKILKEFKNLTKDFNCFSYPYIKSTKVLDKHKRFPKLKENEHLFTLVFKKEFSNVYNTPHAGFVLTVVDFLTTVGLAINCNNSVLTLTIDL